MKNNITPDKLSLGILDSFHSFQQLTNIEKMYAYYMSKASWAGYDIVVKQTSKFSHKIMRFFVNVFSMYRLRDMEILVLENDKNVFEMVVNYAALIFASGGNYLSFGDSKFVPRCSKSDFRHVIETYFPEFAKEYTTIEDEMFSLNSNELHLGYYPDKCNAYFSENMSQEDCDLVDEYLKDRKLEGWNTMCKKVNDTYYVLYPCVPKYAKRVSDTFVRNDKTYNFVQWYGSFPEECMNIVQNLKDALKFAANPIQYNMIQSYIEHFETGDLEKHKESQRLWVKDKPVVVETNIGFIENYRDPAGIRSEFEGFVAVVDKEKSKKLQYLVEHAQTFLDMLPWGPEFEKDTFNPPEFTALDVITFSSSGIPAGINIPNYDDIRSKEGFKNVSLENVINCSYASNELPRYLEKDDAELFQRYVLRSFAVDVAGHELIGHGSGKLFIEDENGNKNFSIDTINPLSGKQVETWYKPGETWSSKFRKLSSSFEECRAECVGLLLSNSYEMQKIFGNEGNEADHVCLVSWIWMIRAGILGLSAHSGSSDNSDVDSNWLQAHSRARYVIYQVLREAGVCRIELTHDHQDEGNEGKESFIIRIDKSKLQCEGLNALKTFLLKLNVYKALADYESGSILFKKYSEVDDFHLKIRDMYMNEMKPRMELIQPTLVLENGNVEYRSYTCDAIGMIESYVDKLGMNM